MDTNFKMENKYITMIKGDTLSIGIKCVDENNNPISDIKAVTMTCRDIETGKKIIFQKSIGDGVEKSSEDSNTYIIRVAPSDTETTEAGKYVYDVEIRAGSDVFTVMKGYLQIDDDVTKPGIGGREYKYNIVSIKGEKGDTGPQGPQGPQGEKGDSSTEVIDARVGYDGTAYDTLGTAIRTQITDLKKDLDNLESGALNLGWYTAFANGGLKGVTPFPPQKNRIYSINPIILDRDIELSVGNFYVFLRVYIDGVYTPGADIDIQPNTVTTLTKGTQFMCVIRRSEEDTSEVADIQEFLAGATFKSNIEKRLEASEESNSEFYRTKSLMIEVNNGNIRLDYFSPFANGGLSDVTPYPPQKNRIYSVNPITFKKDTRISIIKDFYVFLRFYNNGVYDKTLDITVNPYSKYTIPGGVPFKCVIRRHVEVTGETADIQEFLDSVVFNSIQHDIDILKENDNSIQHDIDILKENEWKRTNNIIKFFAHQGYSTTSQYYGNSRISSYKGAFLNGFDAGETDVQWTSDEIAVCCHDATFVDTITNETIIISDHTLEELKTYSYYGEKIATLEEIVSICKVLGLKLEIDHLDIHWSEDKWNKLFDIVKRYQMQNDVVWSIGVGLFNKIMDFDKNSSVVIDASDSVNMKNTIAFVNRNITDYNHIYISFLYTKMPVELIKECSGQLPSRSGLWVWAPDTIENVLAYLPYVKMVTSNKISYSKIIGQIIN